MKKIIAILLTMMCSFTACGNAENVSNVSDLSYTQYDNFEDFNVDFGEKNYIVVYDSNTITGILINPECIENICIDLSEFTEISKIELGIPINYMFLPIFTAERFDNLCETIAENSSERDSHEFSAFYLRKDINDPNLPETAKQNFLQNDPVCEYGVVCIADPTIDAEELLQLERILKTAGIDIDYLKTCAQEVLDLIPDNAKCKAEYIELFKRHFFGMQTTTEPVTEIVFPESAKFIETDNFNQFPNLKKVSGISADCFIDDLLLYDFIKFRRNDEAYSTNMLAQAIFDAYDKGYIVIPSDEIDNSNEPNGNIEKRKIGKIDKNIYTNNFLGLGWTLPEGWTFYADSKLKLFNYDVLSEKPYDMDIMDYLETRETWAYLDLGATNNAHGKIEIRITKIPPENAENISMESLQSQEYINSLEQQLKKSYGEYYSNIKVAGEFVTISEKEFFAINVQLDDVHFATQIALINDVYLTHIGIEASTKDQVNIGLESLFIIED